MLDDIRRLLAFFGTAEIHFGILNFNKVPVAMLNPSNAVVLLPVYQGYTMVERARNVARGETAEQIAALIIARRLLAAA